MRTLGPLPALTPHRKHQKELTPLDLMTLQKCAALIRCAVQVPPDARAPQVHDGYREDTALLLPRRISALCVAAPVS